MFSTRYFRFLFIAAVAVAASCTDDPVDPAESTGTAGDAEPASLTINLSIADLGVDVSTRNSGLLGDDEYFPSGSAEMIAPDYAWPQLILSKVEDPVEGKETLTAKDYEFNHNLIEAALVDGSAITCLTVILINYKENKIVAVRRIPDPDCPNHDVKYLSGTQSYPPTDPTEINDAKKNCILYRKKNGDVILAPVLRDENGNLAQDDNDHITGLVGTHACVTLEYDDPIHKVKEGANIGASSEKLTRGEYTLLVIANYDHNVTTSKTAEGNATLNVDTELEKLADEFHNSIPNGIPDFTSKYEYLYDIRFLMNRTLIREETGTQEDGQTEEVKYDVVPMPNGADGQPLKPYIRPAVHQTLTAAKDIYLSAGDNVIDIELQRIASRTRVEVKNYSPSVPLKVNSLKFSPNYTQSTTYLFRRNKKDRDYKELATSTKDVPSTTNGIHGDHDGKGAPMVNFTGIYNLTGGGKTYGAIVPFVNNMDSDGDKVIDCVGVQPGEKRCIFDALMYESSLEYEDESHAPGVDPESFTCTIDVSYPAVQGYKTPDLNKIDHDKWVAANRPQEYDPERAKFGYLAEKDGHKDYIHDPKTPQALHTSITTLENGLDASKHESLCFFIQGAGASTSKFLCEREDGVVYADRKELNLDTDGIDLKSYLWVMEDLELKDGKCLCYLKNLRSGKYMSEVTLGAWPIENNCMRTTSDKTSIKKCNLTIGTITHKISETESYDEYNVMLANADQTLFLNIWGGDTYSGGQLGGYSSASDPGSQYRLYPIKLFPTLMYIGTPRFTKEVELTTFSDATGFVEKVTEIKRNDFIQILVEVSYNPDKNDFDFKVNTWKTGGGEIAFH